MTAMSIVSGILYGRTVILSKVISYISGYEIYIEAVEIA